MKLEETHKSSTVLVSGKFKVLHAGHLRLLKSAKDLGSKLIVCVDSTDSTEEDIESRISLLAEIRFIDELRVYEGSIVPVIREIKPDIVLKGNEFSDRQNEEDGILREIGGRLLFTSGSTHFSEFDLIDSQPAQEESKLNLPLDFLQRHSLTRDSILEVIRKFNALKVAVIGDLIVDEYIMCHPIGMSQEDPTIVVTPVDKKKYIGGAAIVAAHAASLGAKTKIFSVGGDDATMDWLNSELKKSGVMISMQRDATRPTTLKQRFKAGQQILLKLSHLSNDAISIAQQRKLIEDFEGDVASFDILIFSDFSYGVLQPETVNELISIARKHKLLIAADSQTSSQIGDLSKFKGVDFVTPTEKEARIATRDEVSGLVVLAEKLRTGFNTKNIILKLGPDGLILHGEDLAGNLLPTDKVIALTKDAVDTSGAGDSLLVGSVLSFALEKDLYLSALVGSVLAGIQVSRIGNVPISFEEIERNLQQ